jgi:hypothetical protein
MRYATLTFLMGEKALIQSEELLNGIPLRDGDMFPRANTWIITGAFDWLPAHHIRFCYRFYVSYLST